MLHPITPLMPLTPLWGFGKGSSFVPGTVPRVKSSSISNTSPDGISIDWDRPMMISASLKEAITVKVNGTAVVVKNVVQNPTNPKQLGIVMNVPFNAGDVVTWSYNDQHATEFLKGAEVGGVKADNQTYAVVNSIVVPPVAHDWIDENSQPWVDENSAQWTEQ